MMRRFAIAACAGLAAGAAPAAAQSPDGVRNLTQGQASQELAIYADCVASRRAKAARTLALAPFGSDMQVKAGAKVTQGIDDGCIQTGFDNVRMAVRPDMLAGAVARVMLNRDYPDLPAVIDRKAVDVEAERQRAAQLSVAERFGRCVVWSDPSGVQAFLRADPGTAAERAAIEALKQDLGMCVQEGNTLRLDRSFVRNVAAVAAYRLAQQLRPRGPASGERG